MKNPTRFVLKLTMENEAFDGEHWAYEAARILRRVAQKIDAGEVAGVCMDANGNRVGEWTAKP